MSKLEGLSGTSYGGAKEAPARAKVRWDTLTLPTSQGGFGVTDPKAQSEALLAKLFIRDLAPGGEPWKELVRHNADKTRLSIHGKGYSSPDLHWLLTVPNLKRLKCSMWKSIVEAWLNVRPGLIKSDPTNLDEVLKQPFFGNSSILNASGFSLGVGGLSEGVAFAQSEYSRVKNIWNSEAKNWKGLMDLGMKHHPANRRGMETITTSIPWRPDEHEGLIRAGDWLANTSPRASNPLEWVYLVLEPTGETASVLEFQRTTHEGRIQATTNQATRIHTTKLRPVRVLSQERLGAIFKIAREHPAQGKAPLLYWIFDKGFIRNLPWDPGEWHW